MKTEIIRLRLEGNGRNTIWRLVKAKRESLSPTSVGNVLSEFVDFTKKEGVKQAGVKYGVDVEIEQLFEIADYRQKNNLELTELAQGGRIAGKLKQLGLEADATEGFLEDVVEKALKKKMTGAKLVELSAEIEIIEDHLQDLKNDETALTKKLEALREEERILPSKIKNLKEQEGMIRSAISSFEDLTKKKIEEAGDTALEKIKGFPDKIMKQTSTDMTALKKQADDSVLTLNDKIEELKNVIAKYSAYLEKASKFEKELEIARWVSAVQKYPSEARDLPPDTILQLIETSWDLSVATGFNPEIVGELPDEYLQSHLDRIAKVIRKEIGGS